MEKGPSPTSLPLCRWWVACSGAMKMIVTTMMITTTITQHIIIGYYTLIIGTKTSRTYNAITYTAKDVHWRQSLAKIQVHYLSRRRVVFWRVEVVWEDSLPPIPKSVSNVPDFWLSNSMLLFRPTFCWY